MKVVECEGKNFRAGKSWAKSLLFLSINFVELYFYLLTMYMYNFQIERTECILKYNFVYISHELYDFSIVSEISLKYLVRR